MNRAKRWLLGLGLAVMLVGCGAGEQETPTVSLPPVPTLPPRGAAISLPETAQVAPGESAVYPLRVTNREPVTATYQLTASSALGWLAAYPPTVALAAGASTVVSLNLNLPLGVNPRTSDELLVQVRGADDEADARAVTSVASSYGSGYDYGVDIEAEPIGYYVLPGGTVSYQVVVTNTGRLADSWRLDARSSLGWANLRGLPATISLPAGGVARYSVAASVPRGANSSAIDELCLSLVSPANPLGDEVNPITMGLGQNASKPERSIYRVENPRSDDRRAVLVSEPGGLLTEVGATLSYSVTISNFGTQVEEYGLLASDDHGWADLRAIPARLQLEPGAQRGFSISATVPQDAGPGKLDRISVTARNQNASHSAITVLFVPASQPGEGLVSSKQGAAPYAASPASFTLPLPPSLLRVPRRSRNLGGSRTGAANLRRRAQSASLYRPASIRRVASNKGGRGSG